MNNKAGRSDFRNQRFEPDTGKMRKIRTVPLTPEKQGSEEMPQSANTKHAENADTKTTWKILKVARLQSEFCTERFFSSHEFSHEKCSEIFPENFEPLFCGSEKIPGKFPPNFPLNFPNFPAKNKKKFTDELLQERREKIRKMLLTGCIVTGFG